MFILENKYVWQRKEPLLFIKNLDAFFHILFVYKYCEEFISYFFPQKCITGRIRCDEENKPVSLPQDTK